MNCRHGFGFSSGMKLSLLCFSIAVGLFACSREEPAVGQTAGRTPIDETKQVEKAADANKPLSDASLTQIVRSAMFSRWHDRLSRKLSACASFSRLAQSTS